MSEFHTPSDIAEKLQLAERMLGGGATLAATARAVGVAAATLASWRESFAGMSASQIAHFKALERENAKLISDLWELDGGDRWQRAEGAARTTP